MTETEPELSGTRICRVVKLTSNFRSLFLEDRIQNRPKYKDRIFGHDRTPTPTGERPPAPPILMSIKLEATTGLEYLLDMDDDIVFVG
jgi:hypothetical protein